VGRAGRAAAVQGGAGRHGLLDELGDALHALACDERADRCLGVARIAHPERLRACDDGGQEALEDLGKAERALHRAAALAGVGESRPRGSARRARDVGVGEHEHRVLAVEREDRALEAACAGRADLAPGARGAGEADLGDGPVDQRGTCVGVAMDDAQQALGQSGAREDAGDALGAQRHVR
jgi:hypothetical protein